MIALLIWTQFWRSARTSFFFSFIFSKADWSNEVRIFLFSWWIMLPISDCTGPYCQTKQGFKHYLEFGLRFGPPESPSTPIGVFETGILSLRQTRDCGGDRRYPVPVNKYKMSLCVWLLFANCVEKAGRRRHLSPRELFFWRWIIAGECFF